MNVTDKIKRWSIDRNLHTANPDKQMLKLIEELGELAEGMAKGKPELIKDAVGDVYVVLTILSQQLGIDIEECIAIAYDEIKDRKGRMIDGVFVKEADLPKEDE
jgi:NTP pyrophosphatase (non-canonical NTP hydrolase)